MTKVFDRNVNHDTVTAAAYVGGIEAADVRPEARVNLVGSWFINLFERHLDRLVELRVYEIRRSSYFL